MLKGEAEFQRQEVLNRAAGTWNKEFLRTTDQGMARIRQEACTGVKRDVMDSTRWGWECMLQLQETEDMKTPAATIWAALGGRNHGVLRAYFGWEKAGSS